MFINVLLKGNNHMWTGVRVGRLDDFIFALHFLSRSSPPDHLCLCVFMSLGFFGVCGGDTVSQCVLSANVE